MPEMLEAEMARSVIGDRALGRRIATVVATDAWYLKRGSTAAAMADSLPGRRFASARRIGKQLLLDTSGVGRSRTPGPVLGLHLGMSGRVVVDGESAGDPLLYTSNAENPAWLRFGVEFADGGSLWLRDPRRLGAVELDPDESRLGPDAATLDRRALDVALGRSGAPLKAVLMDQSRVAGLGNLLTDEILWRAGLDPERPAAGLDDEERSRLVRTIRHTVRVLGRRGGSHTGDLQSSRSRGGVCPRDGAELLRRTVGGRTTYSCPVHQR
ncbi:MAG TPA: DNA-formamidopyrimidine glycosylase family protein [Acidimicrobiia bacterium]